MYMSNVCGYYLFLGHELISPCHRKLRDKKTLIHVKCISHPLFGLVVVND